MENKIQNYILNQKTIRKHTISDYFFETFKTALRWGRPLPLPPTSSLATLDWVPPETTTNR